MSSVYNGTVEREDFWVVVKREAEFVTGLTQRERKDNIAEQGRRAFSPVNLNLSSAERAGVIGGHTMNELCKIWVL